MNKVAETSMGKVTAIPKEEMTEIPMDEDEENAENASKMETLESGEGDIPPKRPLINRPLKITLFVLLGLLLTFIILVYVVVPVCFVSSSWIRRTLLFGAYDTNGKGLDKPEDFFLNCPRNFFLDSKENIKVGTWYVPSMNSVCDKKGEMFPGDTSVVLYLHGITQTRAAGNRVMLLKRLTEFVRVHTMAIDYRGFGDSTSETPSLQGVVNDSWAAYQYVKRTVPTERLFIWGHSLGTSVTMHLAARLNKENDNPAGIVLESAFDKISEVAVKSSFLVMYRWLPWSKQMFLDPLANDPATNFDSVAQVPLVSKNVPFLMLHAEDDPTVPFPNGKVLEAALRKSRKDVAGAANISWVTFAAKYGYAHRWIPSSPEFADVVTKFLAENRKQIKG